MDDFTYSIFITYQNFARVLRPHKSLTMVYKDDL